MHFSRYLLKYKWLFSEDGTDPIIWHDFGLEFSPDCVAGQSEHVDLDIRPHVAIREELSGQDLDGHRSRHDPVDWGVCERIKHPVVPAHEGRLPEVPAIPVVLEDAQVQLHGQIWMVRGN